MKAVRFFAVLLLLGLMGCGGGDSGGSAPADFGGNHPNVVVALGDSITAGVEGGGAPWPARLASLSGKTLINAGIGGQESGDGLARIGGALAAYKPGYIIIDFGANDAIMLRDTDNTLANIRAMVGMAKAHKTVPILATLLPMIGEHGIYDSTAQRISAGISAIGKSEGVTVVDLKTEFTDPENQLISDGLHPSDLGNQIIALALNDALPH
ncbi:MAG: hypothetical protein EPN23_08105 [Verrucomicrobia bacterium]|nr:MAG: hypothetical protein EPN23_08105 [Verrucomicrobiota bacterium]